MTKNRVIPLTAMAGGLVLAYVLDKVTTVVKSFIGSTHQVYRGYYWLALLEIFFAGMVILLVWLTMVKSKRSILVGVIFVVVGLICLLRSTFFRFSILSIIPNPYVNLYRYQLQDLPFFQRAIATLLWNLNHGHYLQGLGTPLAFQYFTKASALTTLLGVIKFFQKPVQPQSIT